MSTLYNFYAKRLEKVLCEQLKKTFILKLKGLNPLSKIQKELRQPQPPS